MTQSAGTKKNFFGGNIEVKETKVRSHYSEYTHFPILIYEEVDNTSYLYL